MKKYFTYLTVTVILICACGCNYQRKQELPKQLQVISNKTYIINPYVYEIKELEGEIPSSNMKVLNEGLKCQGYGNDTISYRWRPFARLSDLEKRSFNYVLTLLQTNYSDSIQNDFHIKDLNYLKKSSWYGGCFTYVKTPSDQWEREYDLYLIYNKEKNIYIEIREID